MRRTDASLPRRVAGSPSQRPITAIQCDVRRQLVTCGVTDLGHVDPADLPAVGAGERFDGDAEQRGVDESANRRSQCSSGDACLCLDKKSAPGASLHTSTTVARDCRRRTQL